MTSNSGPELSTRRELLCQQEKNIRLCELPGAPPSTGAMGTARSCAALPCAGCRFALGRATFWSLGRYHLVRLAHKVLEFAIVQSVKAVEKHPLKAANVGSRANAISLDQFGEGFGVALET